MPVESDNSSISGYLTVVEEEQVSPSFTDIELYTRSGHSILLRAKRYGQWWMLKGLESDCADVGVYNQMLRKEFDILIRMQHPGIVHASELVNIEGAFAGQYIAMEWLDGQNWSEWTQEPHTAEEKLNVCRQLLAAVGYIHSQGIVHRDLKPENIMITHNGNYLKIIDFGLSDGDHFSILKQPAGTKGYMSPEQQTQSVADVRNDIYSLGALLEQLDLGWKYRRIIRKCMGPIDGRYPNITLMRQAFEAAGQRTRWPWIAGGAMLLGMLLWAYSERQTTPASPLPSAITEAPQEPGRPQQSDKSDRSDKSDKSDPVVKSDGPGKPDHSAGSGRVDSSAGLREAIIQGVAAFEVEAHRIDAVLDTLSASRYLTDFDAPSKAWKDFYYKETKLFNLSEDELETLYNTLEQNSNARYALWRERIKKLTDD